MAEGTPRQSVVKRGGEGRAWQELDGEEGSRGGVLAGPGRKEADVAPWEVLALIYEGGCRNVSQSASFGAAESGAYGPASTCLHGPIYRITASNSKFLTGLLSRLP